ncbi:monooxygenase [Halobacteriovorax marinus]|uniref:Monooxygenase n=1 Tax=Halobacteriovorax marinus TaxID=97084 RepID=A0A1Y5FAC7_9BACT|nr:monooxygenase [Halobacteriovorax marinus]
MQKEYQVIIIGSGFGGQVAAINLNKQGISDYLILERKHTMGGTWVQNTYPGAAVDIPSPLYSIAREPFNWSQLFAGQEQLREYTEYIIRKHKLREKTSTDSNVTKIEWIESIYKWRIHIVNKGIVHAQFVVNASGPLSNPTIPKFKGMESFQGVTFHSGSWDHSYDYKGKRAAIIGSGASAAQIIPKIAPDVAELHILQRTPPWVMPRYDYKFKEWQRSILKNKTIYKLLRLCIYWWLELRVIGLKYSKTLLKLLGRDIAIRHLNSQIKDPELRKKVKPKYTIGCKRVILSDTLYPSYNLENVSLYDKTSGIKEITKTGITTVTGEELGLDLIIYSTGYNTVDNALPYEVIGRDGKSLAEEWEDFPRAYLGTSVPYFPNLFMILGPNTGIGHTSAIFIIESQLKYIINSIQLLNKLKKKSIEVKESAEARYTEHIHKEMASTVWQQGGCNSWYKSKSGKIVAMFPGFSFTFRRWTKKIKNDDHKVS